MKNSKSNSIGTIIAIVLLIIIIILSNVKASRSYLLTGAISKVFMPVQNMISYIKEKTMSENLGDIESLKEENSKLKDENEKLKEEERELEILKSENNTLKEYLNLKNKYGNYTTQPANVIERSYSNYDKIIIINQGSKSGIKVNMPVISEAGLVGHVISVDENTSKVQTIVDTASTVSTSISTIEQSVLAKGTIGNNNSLKLTSIPTDSTILQGDDVVTSGLGGIYPKGILIGTIGEVVNTKNQTDRYANVKTATNFETLSTVLVIVEE